MAILDKILKFKRREVAEKKSLITVKYLENSIYFNSQTLSLKKYVLRADKSGIIAEIKRKSPSRGILNTNVSMEQTSIGYMQAGASAISVLTDSNFFGGFVDDLTTARKFNFCPILRKDFILDEYQVIESKSIGADAILLIASGLDSGKLKSLASLAHSLGLEVLFEIHSEKELKKISEQDIDLVGINNRNLDTMEANLSKSEELVSKIPEGLTKVSESGIKTPDDVLHLKELGFHGFLIGEQFMIHPRPEEACCEFIEKVLVKQKNPISHE